MNKVSTVKVYIGEDGTLQGMYAYVSSKAIFSVTWFTSGRLHITFRNKGYTTYVYNEVPAEVWNELVNADSIGGKYNEIVRDKFTYTA